MDKYVILSRWLSSKQSNTHTGSFSLPINAGYYYLTLRVLNNNNTVYYNSVPGKRPWALKHNSWFCSEWALTRDITSIILCLYGGCYINPLNCVTWALTREWALARDTRVILLLLPSRAYYVNVFHIPPGIVYFIFDTDTRPDVRKSVTLLLYVTTSFH